MSHEGEPQQLIFDHEGDQRHTQPGEPLPEGPREALPVPGRVEPDGIPGEASSEGADTLREEEGIGLRAVSGEDN
jgi:hypothetical protein